MWYLRLPCQIFYDIVGQYLIMAPIHAIPDPDSCRQKSPESSEKPKSATSEVRIIDWPERAKPMNSEAKGIATLYQAIWVTRLRVSYRARTFVNNGILTIVQPQYMYVNKHLIKDHFPTTKDSLEIQPNKVRYSVSIITEVKISSAYCSRQDTTRIQNGLRVLILPEGPPDPA